MLNCGLYVLCMLMQLKMENGLSGQLLSDSHIQVTDESRSDLNRDIPCLNFDHVGCNIRHNITAKTEGDRKPNGKCDAYIHYMSST